MKCLLIALVTIAVVQANVISTQYHAQDGHNGYSYGYSYPNTEKEETASHDRVKGDYKISGKHGDFHSEVSYDFPQEHHEHHHHHEDSHGFHHEHAKPFSYSFVSVHPEQHHHHQLHQHHQEQHQQNHYNSHHLYKRSLWHHNNNHQQHLTHNEPSHHFTHEEHQHKWTGPIHVPVIKNGVPTESPEVQAARHNHVQKLVEARQHSSHAEHAHGWEDNHQQHHDSHFSSHFQHHHEPKWTGPVHVPVIEHGVPTETPEVKHAKVSFYTKLAEAKLHSAHSGHSDYDHHHGSDYDDHHQTRWTGPIHVPVIEHGVPTETPEVRHAKAHLAAKHAQAHHSGHNHYEGNHYAQHYDHHDNNEAHWTGPTHNPVIVHGVPTETPEVRHAKAHLAAKHAEHQKHAVHSYGTWDQDNHYAHDYHHSNEHRWTGPIHVPVIKHGVPTETPEVRHAKAHLFNKHAEAKSHPDYHSHDDKYNNDHHHAYAQASHEVGWHQSHKHY
ncbi:histidine-rich glycoprotein-like [Phlebotomus papatasi]|uniref:histidine-rich glycoprotein-like n=1 Tax=Phlebotomus papatasi TaxID=29031 RepID=UPI0024845A8A|nr:histidine-rich glycoprotein-like [Phlebotomus papatasi]